MTTICCVCGMFDNDGREVVSRGVAEDAESYKLILDADYEAADEHI